MTDIITLENIDVSFKQGGEGGGGGGGGGSQVLVNPH